MSRVARRISSSMSPPSECGGSTQAESPEWMPASSTCCMIPPIQTSSPSQIASTSTSIAFSRKRSRKIARAPPRLRAASASSAASRGAAARRRSARAAGSRAGRRRSTRSPSRGRRGRSSAARAAGSRRAGGAPSASSHECAVAYGGAFSPSSLSSAPKRPRSSARSIASGWVPSSGTPAALQAGGELERRLAAELDDHALGPLDLDDRQHVLERQRLEVQAVGGVVVGRHRLGVAVDHHRVAARLAHGHRGVHAAVVELDALADPVRARAEDHHARRSPRAISVAGAPCAAAAPRPSSSTASRPRTRRRTCRPRGRSALAARGPGRSARCASSASSRRYHGSMPVRARTSSVATPRREQLEDHVVALGRRRLDPLEQLLGRRRRPARASPARASASPSRTPGGTCARSPSPRRPTSCGSTARRRRPGTSRTRTAAT